MQIYLKKERKGENVEGGVLEPCSWNTHKQATDSPVTAPTAAIIDGYLGTRNAHYKTKI